MNARKRLPLVASLLAIAALVFLAFPVALAGGPQQNSVRVTLQCDKGVTGNASVNLRASTSSGQVEVGATEIPCGETLVVATTAKADSYAATIMVSRDSATGRCGNKTGLLPDTLYCPVMTPPGERPAGGTLRLAKPK
jgi:hypothetical protein